MTICYTHTCRYKLLIQLPRECDTMTLYLPMQHQSFCICGDLTGYMLIITNGLKKSWCSIHWEVITLAVTGGCNAADGFSLNIILMSLSLFFFFPYDLLLITSFLCDYILLFISHFLLFISSLTMKFYLVRVLVYLYAVSCESCDSTVHLLNRWEKQIHQHNNPLS